MPDFATLFPTATPEQIAELPDALVDFDEPVDAICDSYWNALKALDPGQIGIKDLRAIHRSVSVNHRRGYLIRVKLEGQGRLDVVPTVSGRGKRKRTTGALYIWRDAVPVGGDS